MTSAAICYSRPIHILVSSPCLFEANLFFFGSCTRNTSTKISLDSVDSDKLYTRMERKKRGLTIGWLLSDRKETPGNIDMSNIPSEEPGVNGVYFWVG